MAVIPAIAGGAVALYARSRWSATRGTSSCRRSVPSGQRKLMEAKVLVVGAGGLGGPAALYLALAGVGTIGIVDFDTVDLSNLQRQVLHQNDDVGKTKTESRRKETINAYNPDVNVILHETPITSDNAMELITAVRLRRQRRGQLHDALPRERRGVLRRQDADRRQHPPLRRAGDGVRARLRAATAASSRRRPRPASSRVAPRPASWARLPASWARSRRPKTIKQILEIGEPLVGRLLLVDALSMEFRVVKLRRDPKCPLCGDDPTITELIDYEGFCGAPFPGDDENGA